MSRALVIIPTYNEIENIRSIAAAVLASHPDLDLLVVDDGSPDGTGKIADELAAENPRVHVHHRSGKLGLGTAYIAGFRWALERDYAFVFEMDADFSHNPADLPRFLEAIAGADLVLGSRYKDGIRVVNWPLGRLMLSKGAALYVRAITGMPITDPTGGFKCFRREVLKSLDFDHIQSNGYSFQIEVTHTIWRKGYRVAEIPITFEERRSGYSKMSGHIFFEALWLVWRLWARSGFRRRPAPQARSTP